VTRRGRFIVLEGIDGCGSTSQARLLAAKLRELRYDVRETCEPTTGPIGTLIRSILQQRGGQGRGAAAGAFGWATLGLLFAADRCHHVDSLIEPALRDGAIVISDRYALSTVAYESALAPDAAVAAAWLREINEHAIAPDATVVLNVSAEVAEQRRAARGAPEELLETRELQRRLALAYASAEQLVPLHHVVHVDGEGTLEHVAERILEVVLPIVQR
jgi:dTMP kinase